MARIAVTDGMADCAVERLQNAGHEVTLNHYSSEELENGILGKFDAVVVRSATKLTSKVIKSSSGRKGSLKLVGRAGVGIDNIDLKVATKSKVVVCNTYSHPRGTSPPVTGLSVLVNGQRRACEGPNWPANGSVSLASEELPKGLGRWHASSG